LIPFINHVTDWPVEGLCQIKSVIPSPLRSGVFVIRTCATESDGKTKNIKARITGEKSREGFNRKNIRKHLDHAIAIAAPSSVSIPEEWSLYICSFAE